MNKSQVQKNKYHILHLYDFKHQAKPIQVVENQDIGKEIFAKEGHFRGETQHMEASQCCHNSLS